MGEKYRRRNYFIKRELQGKLIFSYFLFVVLGVIVFAIGFSYLTSDSMSITYENYDLQLGATPRILYKEMLLVFWVYIVLGGAFIVAWAMFFSHRIAGPLYKIENCIERMIGGRIGFTIHLRSKDEGKELVDKINRFNIVLAEKMAAVKSLTLDIQSSTENLGLLLAEENKKGEESDHLRSIKEKSDALLETVGGFIIEQETED